MFLHLLGLFLFSPVSKGELVAMWTFDKGLADTHAVLDSLNTSNGKCIGNPSIQKGITGQAWLGEGVNSYILIDNPKWLKFADQITVSAWIQIHPDRRDVPFQTIIGKGDSSWRLQIASTSCLEFACSGIRTDNPYGAIAGNLSINDRKWHHVVGTYDGTKLSLYVDGKLDSQKSATGFMHNNAFPISIGENLEEKGRCFKGAIDEVTLFDHAMTPEEVLSLSQKGKHSLISSSSRGFADLANAWSEYLALQNRQSQRDIRTFLEKALKHFEQSYNRNSHQPGTNAASLAASMYGALANNYIRGNFPTNKLIPLHTEIIRLPSSGDIYINALLWLHAHGRTSSIKETVKVTYAGNKHPNDFQHVVQELITQNQWDLLSVYLDAVFSVVSNKAMYADKAVSELEGPIPHQWCRNNPYLLQALIRHMNEKAGHYKKEEEHLLARSLYTRIIELCQAHDVESLEYELEIGNSLFLEGRYALAVASLDKFITAYRPTHNTWTKKAQIVKGMAQVHLDELGKATDTLETATDGFTDPETTPEALFCLGYGHMIQGLNKQASQWFDRLIEQRPNTRSAVKARLCLQKLGQAELALSAK